MCQVLLLDLLIKFLLPGDRLLSELPESLLHIGVIFGGSLHEGHVTILLTETLQRDSRHLSVLCLDIYFVSDHNEREGLRHGHHSFLEEGLLPLGEVLKGLRVRNVINK